MALRQVRHAGNVYLGMEVHPSREALAAAQHADATRDPAPVQQVTTAH